jgi:TRAP-type C4-dicarboxylate transport system substrate-binding protein
MIRKVLAFAGVSALALFAYVGNAKAEVKLKVGTAAAKESPWGVVFKTWNDAVMKKTSNAVSFEYSFNSTQGSEATMVDKMKAGQMDGVAVTSVGLAKIDKRMLTMQLPGIMKSWKTVEAVRTAHGAEYEKFLNDKKVTLITYGDVGMAHFLSKGFAVKVPDDLKGKSPWVYADDPILKAVYGKIGGVNPFASELMSVLPNIDNGKINCMSVSALAAEMLQWNSKFDNGVETVNGIVVGAVIMSTDSLDKLAADQKAAVVDTGKAMGSSATGLKQKIRNEDDAAWVRFKGRTGVSIYKPTADDISKWEAIFKQSRDTLKTGTFDAALVNKLETTAASNQ